MTAGEAIRPRLHQIATVDSGAPDFMLTMGINYGQMRKALEAVIDLHSPTTMQALDAGCDDTWNAPPCDHEDECPLVDVTCCRQCVGISAEVDEERCIIESVLYPCPTATVIATALGVEP